MKCFARQVPFIIHAIVLFDVVFGVYFVYDVILAIASLFKFSPTSHTFYYALIGICPAVAWLITHTLAKTYGIGTKFPSVGARTMFVLPPKR